MCDVCCASAALKAAPDPYRFTWSTDAPAPPRRGRGKQVKLANNPHAPPLGDALPECTGVAALLVRVDPNMDAPDPMDPELGAGSVAFGFPNGSWTRWFTYGRTGNDFMDLAAAMSHARVDMTWDWLDAAARAAVLAQDAAQLEAAWDALQSAERERQEAWAQVEPFVQRMLRGRTPASIGRALHDALVAMKNAPEHLRAKMLAYVENAAMDMARPKSKRVQARQARSLRRLRALFARVAVKQESPAPSGQEPSPGQEAT